MVDLPQTKVAVNQFVAAMKLAGVQADAEKIRQGLFTKEMTALDGKKYEIALTQNGYPLMIKMLHHELSILLTIIIMLGF